MVLWRGKNAVRDNILSLYYLVVTLQSETHTFNCDKQKSVSVTYLSCLKCLPGYCL